MVAIDLVTGAKLNVTSSDDLEAIADRFRGDYLVKIQTEDGDQWVNPR